MADYGAARGENVRIFGYHKWVAENQTNQPVKYWISYSTCVTILSGNCSSGKFDVWVDPNSTKTGEANPNFLVYASYNGNYPIAAVTEITGPEHDRAESRAVLSIRNPTH